jgi:hypothetical protein
MGLKGRDRDKADSARSLLHRYFTRMAWYEEARSSYSSRRNITGTSPRLPPLEYLWLRGCARACTGVRARNAALSRSDEARRRRRGDAHIAGDYAPEQRDTSPMTPGSSDRLRAKAGSRRGRGTGPRVGEPAQQSRPPRDEKIARPWRRIKSPFLTYLMRPSRPVNTRERRRPRRR